MSSVDQFSDDMDDEVNEINDEYEKVNNPLSYHLKQHFRLRRRQRSERGLSFNESNSQQSDNEKVCLATCLVLEMSEIIFHLII